MNQVVSKERILAAPDTLVNILEYCEQADLLFAQRVCRQWRDLIQSTKSLQKKLFLYPDYELTATSGPDPSKEDEGQVEGSGSEVEANPLLQKHFTAFFDKGFASCSFGPFEGTSWYRACRMKTERGDQICAAFSRADASWRRMVPCRPAPWELQAVEDEQAYLNHSGVFSKFLFDREQPEAGGHVLCKVESSSHSKEKSKITTPNFLTFGLIYDMVHFYWFHTRADQDMKHAIVNIAGRKTCRSRKLGLNDGWSNDIANSQQPGEINPDGDPDFAEDFDGVIDEEEAPPGYYFSGKHNVVVDLGHSVACCRDEPRCGNDTTTGALLASNGALINDETRINWDTEQSYSLF